jgi:hypothetical protein
MHKLLAGIFCALNLLMLSSGAGAVQPAGAPGLTGLFPNLASQPFVPATPPAVLPSTSRVTAPLANPIGTLLNPPGLLPAPLSGPAPGAAPGTDTPSSGSTGGSPGFDRTLFVQSPPVVPGGDEQDLAGDWRRLPTCK